MNLDEMDKFLVTNYQTYPRIENLNTQGIQVKRLDNQKTSPKRNPGSNGFTGEFYKHLPKN